MNDAPPKRPAPDRPALLRSLRLSPAMAALLLATILFLLSGLLPNGFNNATQAMRQATNILRLSAFLGMIAAGQTLIIISGGDGIDLSAGAVVTLSAILTFSVVDGQNLMTIPALLLALGVGAAIGFVNGVGISILKISPLVMTLGMAGVVEGLILVTTQGVLTGSPAPIMNTIINRPLVFGIPGVIFIWILFGIGMWVLLERTAFGKQLFGIGVNRITSRLSGVRVPLMVILTYTLGSALAAFGGFMLLGFTGMVFLNLGTPYLFPSIAAVAVGGTLLSGGKGSYFGTMAGAIVLTLLTSLLTTMQIPDAFRQMILGGTLLVLISIYGRQRALRQ